LLEVRGKSPSFDVRDFFDHMVDAVRLRLVRWVGGINPGQLLAEAVDDRSSEFFSRVLVAEVVLTYIFLLVILGSTDSRAPAGFAGIAIGLALTLIHLISIPVTNTSVNPARSTGPALFVGGWALQQLWLFWVAPIIGVVLAGLTYRWLWGNQES
jgi:aquaporin Z